VYTFLIAGVTGVPIFISKRQSSGLRLQLGLRSGVRAYQDGRQRLHVMLPLG